MRVKIMIGLLALVLVALNYAVYEKEQIIENGETVLLKLAPVDPRSLMQGDYMELRYALENQARDAGEIPDTEKGFMVVKTDQNAIANFVRFHDDTPLGENEKLLKYHNNYGRVHIVPDSFFFQEGHAERYENAQYGVFKFDDKGTHLLVGLVDQP